ncbi:hypothetical protein [Streptomyces sp. MAR4 CNX-425]|uniref:hypothetical protein n=1 Tax=Streptomyces sp. MAR4 CNX-425 TaxID=3406343 RepID=UPI003B51167E
MSDERARDGEKKDTRRTPRDRGARGRPDDGPERGLGLGREGHGGVLLPDGHGEREERGRGGKRTDRRADRERDPDDGEERPDEAPDR